MNAWNIQQQNTSIKFRTLIKSNNFLHNEVDAIFEEAIVGMLSMTAKRHARFKERPTVTWEQIILKDYIQ